MLTALTLNRLAAASKSPAQAGSAAQTQPLPQPDTGNWFASSLELRRGLFVLDLCPETPSTDWLDLYASR